MKKEILEIIEKLIIGDIQSASDIKKHAKLSGKELSDGGATNAAKKGLFFCLSHGFIDDAILVKKEFLHGLEESDDLEIYEITKEAVIFSLVRGSIDNAKEIAKHLRIDGQRFKGMIKQAVLSCLYADDFRRIAMISKGVTIPEDVAKAVSEYQTARENPYHIDRLNEIFTSPDSFVEARE